MSSGHLSSPAAQADEAASPSPYPSSTTTLLNEDNIDTVNNRLPSQNPSRQIVPTQDDFELDEVDIALVRYLAEEERNFLEDRRRLHRSSGDMALSQGALRSRPGTATTEGEQVQSDSEKRTPKDDNEPRLLHVEPEQLSQSEAKETQGAFTGPIDEENANVKTPEKIEPPEDPNIVDWDGPDDPENPLNWTNKRKTAAVAMASLLTLITPLGSSIFAPGVPMAMAEFGSSSQLLSSFVVSVYLLGFTLGPLVIAPMSELYGRVPLYLISNVLYLVFTIACAVSTNLGMLIAFRLLQGIAGATPLTNGGGTISDTITRENRGKVLAAWGMGPLLGPVAGPVIGGFLVDAKGWRWAFWLLAIITGSFIILSFFLLNETYAPVLLERKAKQMRKETGNPNLKSKLDLGYPPRENFRRAIFRPTKMLTRSPVVFFVVLNNALLFSYLYVLFTTFTYVFEAQYGFNAGEAGLAYLGVGVGMMSSLPLIGRIVDGAVATLTKRNSRYVPEYRLRVLALGPILMCIGCISYGWTIDKHQPWIAPILLTIPIGWSVVVSFMSTQTYLIDSFGRFSASALATSTIVRSLMGALLPLAGQSLYDNLGLGWGNTLLGLVALGMFPFTVALVRYGEWLRVRFPVEF